MKLLLNHRIEQIDPATRRAIARDAGGAISEHGYDKLLVATGARSIRPSITGMDLPGVFLLRWIGDTLAFEEFLISSVTAARGHRRRRIYRTGDG